MSSRRLLADALAVVAAAATVFLLMPLGPDFDGYGGDRGEMALPLGPPATIGGAVFPLAAPGPRAAS